METIPARAHHTAEHLLWDVESSTVGDEEESGFGYGPIGETVADDFELLAVLLNHYAADVGSWWLGAL